MSVSQNHCKKFLLSNFNFLTTMCKISYFLTFRSREICMNIQQEHHVLNYTDVLTSVEIPQTKNSRAYFVFKRT